MPADIISSIIVFAATLISIIILGLIAGFSPTLYVAQIAVSAKVKRPIAYAAALMAGVLVAILFLVVLFQVIQLEALVTFIDTTIRAVLLSVVFNMLVGIGFIVAGIWYLRHKDKPSKAAKHAKAKENGGLISLFSLGFVRTFISISGVTATFFAANIISNISITFIERVLFTLGFFAAAIIPFIAIILLMRRNPTRIMKIAHDLQGLLKRVNYQPVVGFGAIILGSCVMIFNMMIVLFY